MPLIDAEKFIKEVVKNTGLRKSFYKYGSSLEVLTAIQESGYHFKLYEFEESINHLKTESPTEEQATMLDELGFWWSVLMYDGSIGNIDEPPVCSPVKCSTCSSCGI